MFSFKNSIFSMGCKNKKEMENLMTHIENGIVVKMLSWKGKVEERKIAVKRETRQLIWTKVTNDIISPECAIDLRDIKEIRLGKSSGFERLKKDHKQIEKWTCFTVFHGSQFNLKNLNIVASSEKECELWMKGLDFFVEDTHSAPYTIVMQVWLRKIFSALANSKERINTKDLNACMQSINCQIPARKLPEVLCGMNNCRKNEISFDDFQTSFNKILLYEIEKSKFFDKLLKYSQILGIVRMQDFAIFLEKEQSQPIEDKQRLFKLMTDFNLQEGKKYPFFSRSEFVDFLFSKQNDLWNNQKGVVYQDMTKPLSHYWIASSHNTYLTGHQLWGESSVECYIRALRMGCRCIELDCWDGPDGMPVIYHGHTLTSKISFLDVIKSIREHAFVTSEYPVVLSLEDHCSVSQQKQMVSDMQIVFGKMLLVRPYDKHEKQLPSPHQLRKKIILKHKTLSADQEEAHVLIKNEENEMDSQNSVKTGIMYVEDPEYRIWKPRFFVLTNSYLFYTDSYRSDQDCDSSDDEGNLSSSSTSLKSDIYDEPHLSQKWFHENLSNGKQEAEKLLKNYSNQDDGTFLVRKSETLAGEYRLSFLKSGKVIHCRIGSEQRNQERKYYLLRDKYFESLCSLVSYYRTNFLVSREFTIILREAVPNYTKDASHIWYHRSTSTIKAEDILKTVKTDGAFIVRPSKSNYNCYTISIRAGGKIKHCRITSKNGLFTIGAVKFESLVELIKYYKNYPFYKNVKLTLPIGENELEKMSWSDKSVMQGYIDLKGAVVTSVQNPKRAKLEWGLNIESPNRSPLEVAVQSEELASDWIQNITAIVQKVNVIDDQQKEIEKTRKIALEMSNLIVYCKSACFSSERVRNKQFVFNEICSFSESNAEKLMFQQDKASFLLYNQRNLSRIYPKAQRVNSANYKPIHFWNCGSQMVALNYQSGDQPMQVNQAKFRDNGACGYLLKPEFMFTDTFDPFDETKLVGIEPIRIEIDLLAARFLNTPTKGATIPIVEIEVQGAPFDTSVKLVTKPTANDGLNIIWLNESCEFVVFNPHLAFIIFVVQDITAGPNMIGQATYPISCLRTGYRSVWLKNEFSEDLELASLLIHININKWFSSDKTVL